MLLISLNKLFCVCVACKEKILIIPHNPRIISPEYISAFKTGRYNFTCLHAIFENGPIEGCLNLAVDIQSCVQFSCFVARAK